jgi:hypothetical protein
MIHNIPEEERPKKPIADVVERTNPFNGEFSPSSVELSKCMRRYYYEKILKIKPKVTPTALIFGIAVHAGVEKFYNLKAAGVDDYDHVQVETVQTFLLKWNEFGILGDLKRNADTGIICMSNYVSRYWEEFHNFKMEEIETKQWIPMPNGTMLLVVMDRIMNQSGHINVVDTKTTSMPITEWYFRQFENHLPTSLYFNAVKKILGRCDSIIIDAIKVPPPSATSKSEAFGRNSFLRTDLQIEDAITTYVNRTDYIMEGLAKPQDEWASHFYCNQGECDKFSGCPFISICKHGFDHPSVRVDFDIGDSSA